MLSTLQIAECRSPTNSQLTAICLPGIDHQTFSNINELQSHVITRSNSYSFILLFYDLNGSNVDVYLKDLKRQHHVVAIFICINPKCNLAFHGDNVFPVIKELIAYKIKSSVVKFFEDTSKKLLRLNHIAPANLFKEKANFFKQQCVTNGKINACYALIIPLNTTDENLYDFQERLIHLFYDLCGDYEPTVCTLYDYLPSNRHIDFYQNAYADVLFNYVKTLSPIRFYLVGNERYILNSTSKYFFENELDNGVADEYNKKYTLIENEPISESIRQNLENVLNVRRPMTNVIIKRLDELQNDIKLPVAIEYVDANLKGREIIADTELQKRIIAVPESPFEFSAAFHTIGQAQDDAMVHIDDGNNENIDDEIQR
ncbi:unnamed protein product [Rotaria sp. Silwood1]|nr:unnamed protein product [Rotaria sp. Silwood1]